MKKNDQQLDPDDDLAGDDGLTIKQRLFVAAITGPALGNATRAAELAGYGSKDRKGLKSIGWELLNKPHVGEAVNRALSKHRMNPEWVKLRLAELGWSSMAYFLSVDVDGKPYLDWQKAAEHGAFGMIKRMKFKIVPTADDKAAPVFDVSIELHDPMPALTALCRIFKLIGPDAEPPEEHKVFRVRPIRRKATQEEEDELRRGPNN